MAAANCGVAVEREAAVMEVAEVYELIKLQQPLLFLHPQSQQVAQSLLGKALRALNVALSVMKQQQQQPPVTLTPISTVKSEPHLISPQSPASADSQAMPINIPTSTKRRRSLVMERNKKKKASSSTWAYKTAMPYDDGYEWRKYGEKKINGTLFTRSYFRCTYKDDTNCPATKHVQQIDDDNNNNSGDTPMFHVIYNNDHTCSKTTTSSAKAAAIGNTGSSSSNLTALLAAGCCNNNMKQEPTGHAAAPADAAMMNMMKQEEPVPLLLLPALVQQPDSACFPYYEQAPQCQEPLLFPVSMEQEQQQQLCGAFRDDGEIPSATCSSSCISGETSWDGYYSAGDMAAAQMAAADDPLHDLERFLMWDENSFFMDDC